MLVNGSKCLEVKLHIVCKIFGINPQCVWWLWLQQCSLKDDWLIPTGEKKRSVAGVDQEELVDPAALADPDSLFYDFDGVSIHHKLCDCSEELVQNASSDKVLGNENRKILYPMILLHGFGASVFSWARVMKPLTQLVGSKVLAFDRPAFGLTSRSKYLEPSRRNPYSIAFSALATLAFIGSLGSGKAIVMGHSAGCLVAVDAYFEAPESVAALILVAPAIVAPFVKGGPSSKKGKGEDMQPEGFGDHDTSQNPITEIWKGILRLITVSTKLLTAIALMVRDTAQRLFKKILSVIVRSSVAISLVRLVMDKFGIQGVKSSWYDPSKVTDHVIQGYTKPLKAKNWEIALLEHTLSMLTDSSKSLRRLSEISCPVLIISGDTDRLVPMWNAKRLAAAIPGAEFEVIANCGHLPHEEKVEEFLSVVNRFLQRTFVPQDTV